MDPIAQINSYFQEVVKDIGKAPMCLSTLSSDGYPNSRFVDLKLVTDKVLIFGTDQRSVKAKEFSSNTKISACMWWDSLGIQIRVKGTIRQGSSKLSDRIFSARNKTAQALATISIQSEQLERPDELKAKVFELASSSPDGIQRPQTWWVYEIYPKEIETLRFMEDRVHLRSRYFQSDSGWSRVELSP